MNSLQQNELASGDLNAALEGLLRKYAVETTGTWRLGDGADRTATLLPGWSIPDVKSDESPVPLLPWRNERRFVELKGLVDSKTIEPILTCRFACMTDGRTMPLPAIVYREFDLVEWLTGSPIVNVYASVQDRRAANVIARLASGVVCSIEAAVTLPDGQIMKDRHELIARRGVASDRVVDTQVEQSSVYAYTSDGTAEYTDTDAELFGLDAGCVALVRAAYDCLSTPGRAEELRQRHRRLVGLVGLALESDRKRQRLAVEGGLS